MTCAACLQRPTACGKTCTWRKRNRARRCIIGSQRPRTSGIERTEGYVALWNSNIAITMRMRWWDLDLDFLYASQTCTNSIVSSKIREICTERCCAHKLLEIVKIDMFDSSFVCILQMSFLHLANEFPGYVSPDVPVHNKEHPDQTLFLCRLASNKI